ncbi:hypothetical protein Bpfe_027026 [Biomphalaria pfeifferi]|uniref:Prokineticin domain-containing protein n=1 Tax=Biomphalaria pfeifferi TaxID=112525 RepID=A0AAD8AYV2_BIOPF|nr:hypothetical protein Bpfe_027026 [Biomphalaria pfeifferi]
MVIYTLVSILILYGIQFTISKAVNNPYSSDFPGPIACQLAKDCGHTGCCLHGKCSRTGATLDKCYTSVYGNGRERPAGIWNETDLCPCMLNDYCLPYQNPEQIDPKYGTVGFCNSIMK